MTQTVINQAGRLIDYNQAVHMMDNDLREELHHAGILTDQAFFDQYAAAHREVFGEEFEPNKANPVW